jgi:hypothetical protein
VSAAGVLATTLAVHAGLWLRRTFGCGYGYAATGVPILVDILLKKSEPIWDVSNYLRKLADSQQPEAALVSE